MERLEQYLIENFKWFHRHPELSYEEVQTTARIRELLTEAGIEILPYPLETGLVAVIRGQKDQQTAARAALRCDIDALPIVEQTSLEYRSEIPGHMHACGHDLHITAGIGAALLLQERRQELSGTIKLIFQPAEEEAHGALKILETDVMADVPYVWGFHADPTNPVNVIGVREGYVTAAVDRFAVKVRGVGCHGAHPDDGVDPILAASAIVQALQSIVSRNVNSFHPSLLSVTRITGGTTWNVIPAEAELEGTVRTMDRHDRVLYERRVKEISEQTAAAYGAEAEVEWTAGPPAAYNDGRLVQICEEAARRLGMKTVSEERSMGGDDFAFYEDSDTMGRQVPGCYVKIGTGVGYPIHHSEFCVDTRAILPAARYLAQLLLTGIERIPPF
ncbi:MAG: amidohydrolase [Clostridiales bacterium]|nr:amidohydrolase [Clostridiales bacterium]